MERSRRAWVSGLIIITIAFTSPANAWAGSVEYLAHQLKRMADAQEDLNVLTACEVATSNLVFSSQETKEICTKKLNEVIGNAKD